MFIKEIENILVRDIKRLKKEIEAFQTEEDLWKTSGSISNSAGHLALHLCGNLRHYIGHVLGGSSYNRNRKLEFHSEPISRIELLVRIKATAEEVAAGLKKITETDLEKTYPILVFKDEMSTQFFLIHLSGHLNYHLGQVNSLRRMF